MCTFCLYASLPENTFAKHFQLQQLITHLSLLQSSWFMSENRTDCFVREFWLLSVNSIRVVYLDLINGMGFINLCKITHLNLNLEQVLNNCVLCTYACWPTEINSLWTWYCKIWFPSNSCENFTWLLIHTIKLTGNILVHEMNACKLVWWSHMHQIATH